MASNDQSNLFLCETQTQLQIGSKEFLGNNPPVPVDFSIYVPLDVNAIFAHMLNVPITDAEGGGADDQQQGMTTDGTFAADSNTTYLGGSVVGAMASRAAAFDLATYDVVNVHGFNVEEKLKDVICELFMGVKSSALPSGTAAQTGVGHRILVSGNSVLSQWIEGADYRATGSSAASSWGQLCFTTQQFGEIATTLVALAKYQTDATHADYRKPLLATNDCIGIPILLTENADNTMRVNFYFQQTTGVM